MPRPPPTPCARSGRASRSNTPSRAAPRRAAGRAPPSAASAAVGRHSIPEVRRRRLGCQHRDRLGERHDALAVLAEGARSEEHTSELQSLMRISYAVFCLKKKKYKTEERQR